MSTDTSEPQVTQCDPEAETAYSRAEQAHYGEICNKQRHVSRLEDDYEEAKAAASEARKLWERATRELHRFIAAGPETQQTLPGMEEGAKGEVFPDWRLLPVEDLPGVADKYAKALVEADITTLGNLSSHMETLGNTWHQKVPNVGDAGAEEIADGFTKFWEDHPEYTNTVTCPNCFKDVVPDEEGDCPNCHEPGLAEVPE